MGRRVGYSPAITSEQSWGDWWNDHRFLMNPLATGAFVGLVGVTNALVMPVWPHTIAWVAIATLGLMIWTLTLADSGQRFFYRLLIACSDAWIFLMQTSWATEHWRAFTIGWLIATMLGGIGYATDQRERHKVAVRKEIDSWPAIAKTIGIPKAWISQKMDTASGYRRRLSWPDGVYTISDIKGLKEKIEAAMSIPAGQLRLESIMDGNDDVNSNAIDLIVNNMSPARKKPVPFGEPTMHSIMDPMLVGTYEDGEQCTVCWFEKGYGGIHTLAAGITRSGKSGLYRLMLGESAPCNDVVRWGIDAKGGVALRPWGPMFDWLVCGRDARAEEEQAAMLERLNAILIYRELYMAERKWDVWKVSRQHPLIILYVDEAAEVFGMKLDNFNAVQLVEKIHRMGAGCGVLVCSATQYPTAEAVSSSQIKSQIGRKFCFRLEEKGHQHVVLSHAHNIDCTLPEKPAGARGAGWCFLSDGGHMREMPLRVRDLKPEKVFELIEAFHGHVGKLDSGSANIPVRAEEYAARKRFTLDDVRPDREGDDVWEDERPEFGLRDDDENVTAPVTAGVTENVTAPVTAGSVQGVTTAKEQVVTETEQDIPAGVRVSLDDLTAPRTPEEAAALELALAQYQVDNEEWDRDRALEVFWATIQVRSGTVAHRGPGVRVDTLKQVCHRSASWVHDEMDKARRAGLIVLVKPGSPYYRLADGAKIPGVSDAA